MTSDFIPVARPQVGEEEIEAVADVLRSGHFVSGEKVEAFEFRFAEYIGCRHAVAVNSGTTALQIVLAALGIGQESEVIVPPLTFFATVSAVLGQGGVPVFADIDSDDFCLSPEDVEARISERTRAIIPVHLFGNAAKMDEFLDLSRRTGIPIIEDCAQAHGTGYRGRKVGALGRAGCFSFFATKHMTTGEGGMITTDDDQLAKTARIIRNHGMVDRDRHVLLGFNGRMTEMEAAMGLVQLSRLEELNAKRIANSETLLEEARKLPWVDAQIVPPHVRHTYFWCPLMVEESSGRSLEQLKAHLRQNGIGFRQRYQEPLYRQPVLDRYGIDYGGQSLLNVEKVAGRIIGLPNHPGLSPEDLDRIVDVLNAF